MPMNPNSVMIGTTFIDTVLASQPPEYRIHKVERINDDHIVARHIASDNLRTFPTSTEVMKGLDVIPNFPDVQSNLDCLVSKKVVINLRNGGRITGVVTAIRYERIQCLMTMDEGPQELKQVSCVELDNSGITRYTWPEIQSIEAAQ